MCTLIGPTVLLATTTAGHLPTSHPPHVLPLAVPLATTAAMNYNVRLALWWTLLENASASLRSGDVLSVLLFLATRSQVAVGFVQGVNGVLQLVAAIPAGVLADRHRRDTVLRWGAAVGCAALCWMVYALLSRPTVAVLAAGMALLGLYRGSYNSALEALFADSVQHGKSSPFNWR